MKKQKIILVIIILIILTMSVGYSIFKISTTVQGKASMIKDLNVDFISIGKIIEEGSVDAFAYILDDKKTVIIDVPKLMHQGSYAIIPITVKNVGQLPAKLESIYEYGTNDNLFEITYDGIAVTDKALQPNEKATFTIKVLWKNEIENDYESRKFYIKFNYTQG